MSLESRRHPWRTVLGLRDVRLVLAAALVSQTGDWVLRTGIAYLIYALTGSTVASAIALLASLAPQVLLGSVAGACVDRWDRRRVMIVVNVALGLVLLPLLWVRGADQVWLVYAVLAASSCLSPFFVAAEATMLPAIVDRGVEDATARITANALNAQVRDLSRLVGAALGGLLAAAGGTLAITVADLVTFVVAAGLIAAVRHRPAPQPATGTHLLREWADGFAVIRHSRALLVVAAFMAVTGIGESIMGTLFAPFTHDILGGSARAYGLILAAQAVGGIVGGAAMTVVGHRFRPRTLFGVGAVIFGLLDLALFCYPLLPGAAGRVWPALVIIALVGLPGAALLAGMITTLQNATTDRVRGRVFGTVTALQNATMLAATAVVGGAAEQFGIIEVLVVQGAGYVAAGLLVIMVLHTDPVAADATAAGTERARIAA